MNIKSIWENQNIGRDIISKTKIDTLFPLNCFLATNTITGHCMYIMTVSNTIEIPPLLDYRFKGVEIFSTEINDRIELNILLLDNDLKDIFALFVQNIIEVIQLAANEKEAIKITFDIISKWKKIFSKINFNGLTLEAQKGLLGELYFFYYLLNSNKSPQLILDAWGADNFEDKDYSFQNISVEIKLTASKYPKITITNERQLETNDNDLFLVLYIVESVKNNGIALNTLIQMIREKLQNTECLYRFNQYLLALGYRDEHSEHYTQLYAFKETNYYTINDNFPKITKSQIPLGLYNISYNIELSAVNKFTIDECEILQKI